LLTQIVLWEMLCRYTPFSDLKNPHAIMKFVSIEKGRPNQLLIPPNTPKDVRIILRQFINLMTRCWDQSPNSRPSFSQIYETLKLLKI
jgi:hypothetical protein